MNIFGDALREVLGVGPGPDGDPFAATRIASVIGVGHVSLRDLDAMRTPPAYEIVPLSAAELALMPDDWLKPVIREEDLFQGVA